MDSEPTTDLTGKTVGEYEITARIGVGGMGIVYEGKHPLIGKRVAVKVLLPGLSREEGLVERFISEARAVNEIRHRGIVDIFSFGQLPDGSSYIVMELLQGKPFDALIKERAPLPVDEALGYLDEVLEALDAAHRVGIIHRDIKPSNLFLVDTGNGRPYVKLLDFGIAKHGAHPSLATPQTRASAMVGTPAYMAPEQSTGKPIAPATDVYATACVLFELVTRQRVFKGENSLRTMWMHLEDPPPKARSLNSLVPKELDEALHWALEKSVDRRPSAAEFRQALEAVRLQLPAAPRKVPPTSASGRLKPVAESAVTAPSTRNLADRSTVTREMVTRDMETREMETPSRLITGGSVPTQAGLPPWVEPSPRTAAGATPSARPPPPPPEEPRRIDLSPARPLERLARLVAKLRKLETETGREDAVTRELLARARVKLHETATDDAKREGWQLLDQVSARIGR